MSSPFIPCPFSYSDCPQGGVLMPMIVASRNPSDTQDAQYASGYFWLSDLSSGGSGNLYVQSGNSAGLPNWTAVTAGAAGSVSTLSDGSTTVSPVGGNIAIVGTAGQIAATSSAPAHEIILTLPVAITTPGSLTTTTTLTVGTNLTVNGTITVTGAETFSGNVTIGGTLGVTGLTTLAALTQVGTANINASGTAATSIGNSTGAITITTGSGNLSLVGGGNTVGLSNDSANNTVVLGSNFGTSSTHIQAGTNNLLLDGATTTTITLGSVTQTGTITVGQSTAGENISIGSAINTGAQEIDIANGASGANSTVKILSGIGTAGAGVLQMANNTRVTTIDLGNIAPAATRTTTIGGGTVIVAAVTDTINVGTGGATTNANSVKTVNVNTGGVTLGQVLTNIATGTVTSGTHTTAIATGNRAAGTMAVNVLTGTGTKTLSVGNADGLTTSTFLGPVNLNASQNNNTAINSGTSTGTVTIGNALAGAIAVDTASTLTIGSATSTGAFTFGASTAGQTVNINDAASNTVANIVNILSGATPGADTTLNVMCGAGSAGTQTVNMLATGATRAGAVNIGTGNAGHTIAIGGSNTSNTTTITAGVSVLTLSSTGCAYPGKGTNTAPAAGFIGEQIRNTVAFGAAVVSTTTTVTNVCTISLTTGVWDVSGIVMFTGMTTATFQQASIGTSSGTIGTVGDNAIQSTFASTTAGDFGLSIPSLRVLISGATTVYLVGQGTYSVGTGKLYGRISATRVA